MNRNRKNTTGLFLVMLFACLSYSPLLAQEQQNDLKESYIGRWYGNVTTQNIQKAGSSGSSGFHQTTKIIWWYNFDVKFLHPMDDPSFLNEVKKRGLSLEYIKKLKDLNAVPDELKISGHVNLSGLKKYTHETKEYCEGCAGKDGTKGTNFPGVRIDVSGRVDLIENKINFHFENVPEKYQIGLGLDHENIKLVSPDMIEVNYKFYEGPKVSISDQKATGKLYRIQTKKDTLGKTVFVDEPIKTDKFTQNDIVIPDVGEFKVKPESECKFNNENSLEHFEGTLRHKVRKMKKDGANFEIISPHTSGAVSTLS